MTDLGVLPGHAGSVALSINNLGQIVGESNNANGGDERATLFDPVNGPVDLGTLGGTQSQARQISDAGVIIGWASSPTSFEMPAYQAGAGWQSIPNTTDGHASAISPTGLIVGDIGFFGHAMLYQLGGAAASPTDLGAISKWSYAYGVNSQGDIVGTTDIDPSPNTGNYHAAIFRAGAPPIDLNTLIAPNSGWVLESAMDINDDGLIVGYGGLHGVGAAFVLTPVPEPATVGLACAGAAMLLRRALRRARRRTRQPSSPARA